MATTSHSIPSDRMAVLFAVMLVAAAGNTAMHHPADDRYETRYCDVWGSLAFSWSHCFGPDSTLWARQSDKRGARR